MHARDSKETRCEVSLARSRVFLSLFCLSPRLLSFYFLLFFKGSQRRMRAMSRRRQRRFESFDIEMNYESLQLQTLQFCVMGYDVYSRQKVIGDVLLPLAELAQQGLDITRELVMWRDLQTSQPVNSICSEVQLKLTRILRVE